MTVRTLFRLLIITVLFPLASETSAATITWVGGVNGSWHTAGNWDLARVPGAGDDVVIPDLGNTASVTYNSGSTAIQSLTCAEVFLLSAGTLDIAGASTISNAFTFSGSTILTGTGDITISNAFNWSTADITGTGTITIAAGSTWSVSGVTPILARPLNNDGQGTQSSSTFAVNAPGVFRNRSGGTFELLASSSGIAGTGAFENQAGALLRRTTATNTAVIAGAVTNAGTIRGESGTLQFSGGLTNTGTLEALSGGIVQMSSALTSPAASTITVQGELILFSGSSVVDDSANVSVPGTLTVTSSGVLDMARTLSVGTLNVTGGTLTGAGNITVTTGGSFLRGAISGTGLLTFNAGSNWTLGSLNPATLTRTIENSGTCTTVGTTSLTVTSPGLFRNRTGGIVDLQSTTTAFAGTGTVQNDAGATIRKTVGAGTVRLDGPVVNNGLVRLETGTLNLNTALTNNAVIETLPGSTLLVSVGLNLGAGSTLDVDGNLTYGGGTSTVDPAATMSVDGTMTLAAALNLNRDLTVGSVVLNANGLLQGSGNVTVTSAFTWNAGSMGGSGTTTLLPGIAATFNPGPGTQTLSRLLRNEAAAVLGGTGSLTIGAGGTLRNASGSSLTLTGNNGILGTGTIEVEAGALLVKSGGTGSSDFSGTLNNTGTVRVATGTLRVTGGITGLAGTTLSQGTWDLFGTLRVPVTSITAINAAVILDGASAQILNSAGGNAIPALASLGGPGSLTLRNGKTLATTAAFANAGAVTLGPGGASFTADTGYTQTAGSTTLDGGTLASALLVDVQGGTLGGNGTVLGSLANGGTVAPGASPGSIDVTGNYTQAPGGTLSMEIGGLTPVTQHDRLNVTGTASLDGSLTATLINGFTPAVPDSVTILSAAAVNGGFSGGNLPIALGNDCFDVVHRPAAVRVRMLEGVVITQHPANATVCEGEPVTFRVAVTGEAPGFQWRKDGNVLPGAVLDSLVIPAVTVADAGSYDVLVTNSCGGAPSGAAVLTVNRNALTLSTTPVVICAGSPLVLSLGGTALPAAGIQWRRNGVDLPGETGLTFTIPLALVSDSGSYDAVVTHVCGSGTLGPVAVTVVTAPILVSEPVDEAVCLGSPVTLAVSAIGPSPAFQWRKNGAPLPGETDSLLVRAAALPADSGSYDCIVTLACGADTTRLVSLAVISCGPNTILWTGRSGDGSWHTPGNWNLNRVPVPADDAVIPDLLGTASVTHSTGTTSVNTLDVSEPFVVAGSTLALAAASSIRGPFTLSGTLQPTMATVSGPFQLAGGTIGGSGSGVLTVAPGTAWTVSGGAALFYTLDNFGQCAHLDASAFGFAGLALFRNRAGGVYDFQADGTFAGEGQFMNLDGGLIRKTGGAGPVGSSFPDGMLSNAGTLRVESGRFRLNSFTNADSIITLPGTTVACGPLSTFTTSSGSTFHIGGTVVFDGSATLADGASVVFSDSVNVIGGTATFQAGVSIPRLRQAAHIGGLGVITVTGRYDWTGGDLLAGPTLTVAAGATATLTPGASLLSRSIMNRGDCTWGGNGLLLLGPGVTFQNEGNLTVTFGLMTSGTLENAPSGFMLVNGNATINSLFSQQGQVTIAPGRLLKLGSTYLQSAGTTTLNGGAIQAAVTLTGGVLRGTGTITGDVFNAAEVAPGTSPGSIQVNGIYRQSAAGKLTVELNGTAPGTGFDVLTASSSMELNGELAVIAGFAPAPGDSFTVLGTLLRLGTFATTNLPLAAGAACIGIEYTPSGVLLRANPGVAITLDPVSQPVCLGAPVTLVTAGAGSGLSFQWRKNSVPIGGATGTSLTIAAMTPAAAGNYDVVLAGNCGNDTSAVAVVTAVSCPDTLFVDVDALPGGNGQTWATAFQGVQAALGAAKASGDIRDIWVAEGRYTPHASNPDTSFVLLGKVALFGGFAGTETLREQRNPAVHRTILSGDLLGNDTGNFGNAADNSKAVVRGTGVDSTSVLDGFIVTAGNAPLDGGGIVLTAGARTLFRGCAIDSNQAQKTGGGVLVQNSRPVFTDCTWTGNLGLTGGGGLAATGIDPIVISGGRFTGNRSVGGLGGALNLAAPAILAGTRFEGNLAKEGGALLTSSPVAVTLTDCPFANNTATDNTGGRGGAVSLSTGATLTALRCDFTGNLCTQGGSPTAPTTRGGAIDNNGAPLILTHCNFIGNAVLFSVNPAGAGGGGAIFGPAVIRGGRFESNGVTGPGTNNGTRGGAVYARTGLLDIRDTRFLGNFVGTSTQFPGGAVAVAQATPMTIVDCEFSGNVSRSGGGAINIDSTRRCVVSGCTISRNRSLNSAGAIRLESPVPRDSVFIENCIVYNNTDQVGGTGQASQISLAPPSPQINFCDIQGLTGSFGGVGNIDANPLFGDDDGADNVVGTLDDDLTLGQNSPCVDAGDNARVPAGVTTDLAGAPRFVDDTCVTDTGAGSPPIVDLGALERQQNSCVSGVGDPVAAVPVRFSVGHPVPNPARGPVVLAVSLDAERRLTARVFDVSGRRVALISDDLRAPGRYEITWDGTEDSGAPVAAGLYFLRVDSGTESVTRRVVLAR